MNHENPTPIILTVYNDLLKSKQKLELKIQKLEVRIRVLHTAEYSNFVLIEKLVLDMEKAENNLSDINHELDLFEKKLNGGASLDKFLETGKVESE